MASKILSVTIDETVIKICEVSKIKDKLYVHKTIAFSTPPGSVEDGYLRNINELGRVIKDSLNNNAIKTKNIMFSIYSSRIATREVSIPIVKENKISDIVLTNAAEYFPVNIDDYLVTYSILGKDTKLNLMVYAAPELMVAGYFDLADLLEKTVISVDYMGNSSAHIMSDQIGSEVSLVLQVEKDKSIVTIYKDNKIRIQRIVGYGIDTVSYLVSDEKNEKESEEADIMDSLRYLIENINRVVSYYNTKFSDEPIQKAYMAGESIMVQGLDKLFSEEFGHKVKQIEKLKNVLTEKNSNTSDANISRYAINLGAVIAPCSFRPKAEITKAKKRNNLKYFRMSFLVALLIAVMFVVLPLPAYFDAVYDLENLENRINNLKHIQTEVDEYYAQKDQLDDMKKFVDTTITNNDSLSSFIKDLEEISPSDISIRSMSINDGSVGLSAQTSTKETIAKYITELNKLAYVRDVVVNSMSEETNDDGVITTTFSLTCTFIYQE